MLPISSRGPHSPSATPNHYFGKLGHEGKLLLKQLLDETPDEEPISTRVFERLGLSFTHTTWRDFDLYWADEGDEAVVEALEEWNAARSMS